MILSPEEIAVFFENVPGIRRRAGLMCCYGAGLRISEAVGLHREGDIDSQRMLIRVQQGKGQKDRYVMLSPRLLAVLRTYYRAVRQAGEWLFPSWRSDRHLTSSALGTACRDACQRSGLHKRITAHTLRHYAEFRTMPSKLAVPRILARFQHLELGIVRDCCNG